jgi:hypothetical protein
MLGMRSRNESRVHSVSVCGDSLCTLHEDLCHDGRLFSLKPCTVPRAGTGQPGGQRQPDGGPTESDGTGDGTPRGHKHDPVRTARGAATAAAAERAPSSSSSRSKRWVSLSPKGNERQKGEGRSGRWSSHDAIQGRYSTPLLCHSRRGVCPAGASSGCGWWCGHGWKGPGTGLVSQGLAPRGDLRVLIHSRSRSARQPSSAEGTVNSTTLSDTDTWHTSRALRNVYFPPLPTQPPPQRPEPPAPPQEQQQGQQQQQQQQQEQRQQQRAQQQGEQGQQEPQGSNSRQGSQSGSKQREQRDGT